MVAGGIAGRSDTHYRPNCGPRAGRRHDACWKDTPHPEGDGIWPDRRTARAREETAEETAATAEEKAETAETAEEAAETAEEETETSETAETA